MEVITVPVSNASLSSAEYERINILLDNQHQLILVNEALEDLGKELKSLEKIEKTSALFGLVGENYRKLAMTA